MVTQAVTLQEIATDLKLTLAASEFYRHLSRAAHGAGSLTKSDAEQWAAPMLRFLSSDDPRRESEAA